MDLPQISSQREALGRKRQELWTRRNREHEKWLARVAYLIQSYNRELVAKRDNRVVEGFISSYESNNAEHKTRMRVLEEEIGRVDQEIERLAGMGL